jgi:4-hydroxybenzoyl-CoA reductase subunit beta
MRLPEFEYYAPQNLKEALLLKGETGSGGHILAGGTDLVVNLKHRVISPQALISLKNIEELKQIETRVDSLVIGASATLVQLSENQTVKEQFPLLAKAVMSIGAPTIQHYRGTIGGNLCLTPRCIFYNQSSFWRSSAGLCLRTGGKDCLALPGSTSCVSICSSDTAGVLTALSAQLTVASRSGTRSMPITEFFSGKGEAPFTIMPNEMVTEIRIPLPWRPFSSSYQRSALRAAVDFPLMNASAVAIRDNGRVEAFRLVLSACGPSPIPLREIEARVKGREADPGIVGEVGAAAVRVAEGIVASNTSVSREYRIKLAGVLAKRAFCECMGMTGA